MAGHSKWANIKRKKQANDAKRSNIFSKMSRLITTAVKEGGGKTDPEVNFQLRVAIDRAKEVNMPNDTIQRAIDAASTDNVDTKEIVYEGFGPSGVAMLISTTTDNGNRTYSEVRQVLDKNNGKIASANAVSHMFQRCGIVELSKEKVTEEEAFMCFDKLKGIDLEESDKSYIMYIPFTHIGSVKDTLDEVIGGIKPESLDVYYLAENPIAVSEGVYKKVERLQDKLEDHDDVQAVYTNAEVQ